MFTAMARPVSRDPSMDGGKSRRSAIPISQSKKRVARPVGIAPAKTINPMKSRIPRRIRLALVRRLAKFPPDGHRTSVNNKPPLAGRSILRRFTRNYLERGFLAPWTSKWRWGPVERPVDPMLPIVWPLATVSPTLTKTLLMWA